MVRCVKGTRCVLVSALIILSLMAFWKQAIAEFVIGPDGNAYLLVNCATDGGNDFDKCPGQGPISWPEAKKRAAEQRTTLRRLFARGLRRELDAGGRGRRPEERKIRWVTVEGGLPPGLDLEDRERMHDWLRGR